MAAPVEQWVFMTKGTERVTQLGYGLKGASVTSYRGVVMLHLRRYYGETELKFPTKTGMTLTRQEFEHLLAVQGELLAEFDKLQLAVDNKAATTSATTTRPVPVEDDSTLPLPDDFNFQNTPASSLTQNTSSTYTEPSKYHRDPSAYSCMNNADPFTGMNYTPSIPNGFEVDYEYCDQKIYNTPDNRPVAPREPRKYHKKARKAL